MDLTVVMLPDTTSVLVSRCIAVLRYRLWPDTLQYLKLGVATVPAAIVRACSKTVSLLL